VKVLVFNVKYSDNLGDGLLALCLEKALAGSRADVKVETLDIAGRTEFGSTNSRRAGVLRVLQMLPAAARRIVISVLLQRTLRRLRQRFDRSLKSADLVVIGGGNLFQDDDLNFPLKVGLVLDCVARSSKPLAIHAVGVSAHWSKTALKLFGRIRGANVISVSVRDQVSLANWQSHFPAWPLATIAPDPGLLARELSLPEVYPASHANTKTVAVCVTAPFILRRHASISASAIPLADASQYACLIQGAVDLGFKVKLFCNGAREDQFFLAQIARLPELSNLIREGRLTAVPRPKRPEELVLILKGASVILAHRLHACIAAYSLGIPHVGLGWDNKLPGFFDYTERGKYCLSGTEITQAHILSALVEAHIEGIEQQTHSPILEAAELKASNLINLASAMHALDLPVRKADGTKTRIKLYVEADETD
jgi:polysaccharide pyruvyl transferase WcaK-like protein